MGWLATGRFLLYGKHPARPAHVFTSWLFLRLLGVVYLIAFVSVWVQIHGLVGSDGILPVGEFLDRVRSNLGAAAYWRVPTLCWIRAGDTVLHLLCAGGVVLSVLLIAGVAPLPVLVLLWATYLSVYGAGQIFLSFQWDALLLETTLMAWFVAPLRLRPRLPRDQSAPSRMGIWLLRFLVFKLMFLSGVTKLISKDPVWADLSALDYHYFTQPLPSWTSWYAHHLPARFHHASVFVMFVIEIFVPFLIFLPRVPRMLACWATLLLQAAIAATGNFGFFNLLTAVLCVSLLDDAFLSRLLPRRLRQRFESAAAPRSRPTGRAPRWSRRTVAAVLATLVLAVSSMSLVDEMVRTRRGKSSDSLSDRSLAWCERRLLSWGEPWLLSWSSRFHSINGYGLFRVMTTERPELVIEVSDDGRTWRELQFRWKPGDLRRSPRFVAPHQPRLDWQMWFAALNPRRAGGWLESLALRILEGSPDVLSLMGQRELAAAPPRFVRFVSYRYEFMRPEGRRKDGRWWNRQRMRMGRAISLPQSRDRT